MVIFLCKLFASLMCLKNDAFSNKIMKECKNIICICLSLSFLFWGSQKCFAQCGNSAITASYSSKCLPALVKFIASPAFVKGSIYYWNFGNGQVLGSDTAYYQYTNGGNYGVSLTVIKPDGSKCTIIEPNGFIHFNPTSNPGFYADQTKICSSPAVISLHDTTSNIVSRDWYINGDLYPLHGPNIKVTDTATGYASIALIVYDNSGCSQNVTKQRYINMPEKIPVNFCSVMTENVAHNQISAKFKVGFDTTEYNISEYDWSFPGGNPSSFTGFMPPSVIYSNLATLQDVTLSVKTVDGCVATYTKQNLVGKYYSVAKTTLCEREFLSINYIIYHDDGRDNGFDNILSDIPFGGIIGPGWVVRFNGSGIASLKFILKYLNSNCYDTLVVPDLFTILAPGADFSLSANALCSAPGKIKLHALHGNPASGTNSYTWQIYDSTSMTQVPGSPIGPISVADTAIVFNQQGYYSVRLIVTNTDGCSDTVYKTNTITVGTPDINYQFIHDTLCVGDTLYINNLTKWHDMPGNPLRYIWYFITYDSPPYTVVYSAERSPRLVFTHPGAYNLYYFIESGAYVGSGQGCAATQDKNGAVFVNGISGIINANGNEACPPVTYNLSATITGNSPKNSPLKYSWSVYPSGDATIVNPTDSTTNVVFNKQDCYGALLSISNGTCTSVIEKDSLICIGTTAAFSIPLNSCRNNKIRPKNLSTKRANVFKWSTAPSTGVTINNDTARSPAISFKNPGCYRILLQTSDSTLPNCYDTISQPVCIYMPPVVKNMYSPDSASHCAPRIDSFYVNTLYGKTFYWNFGDGTTLTSKDSVASHAYLINSNAGFTIRAVAIDSNGCASDTFVLKNYIKISGPEPAFSISSKPPCDSGTVFFTNKSKFVYNYYFIYGDNSGVDSNIIKPHFYKYEDYSRDSNTYVPTLFAYDETGCLASTTSIVKLYRPPKLKIAAIDTVGCMPLRVQFYDSTLYASRYLWNFGDGWSDTGFAPSHIFNKSSALGNPFKVTLTAITDKGCSDTSMPVFIDIHPLSVPMMQIDAPKILCYGDTVRFQALTTGALPVRYRWKFGDGNLVSDTSSLSNPEYHYVFAGKHTVSLTVYTTFGCSDSVSDSTTILNLDSFAPIAPKIDYVTVTPSNQVQVVFSKIKSAKFSNYIIYRFPGPDSIYSSSNANDTMYFDNPPQINVDSQSYSYTIRSTDICGFVSPYSSPQHSILLTVNVYKLNALKLNWNKYTGWDSVKSYQVYRKNSVGKFVLLATVGAIDSTYLDSNLCPGLYTYYIKAIDQNGKYYSTSDTASNKPDYLYQSTPLTLVKATVVNDNSVFINWDPTVQLNFKTYSIDRYSIFDGWQLNYFTTTGLFFTDNSVDVNKYSYKYRVNTIDECGDISPSSNLGTSILLSGSIVNDSRLLIWNNYRQWASGISSYHLQIIQNNGSFKDIALLSPTDTSYFDSSPHMDLNVPTCYRVYAVGNADNMGRIDTSLSNITCPSLPARIFIPTAFSPNSDSINDVFLPVGISVIINPELPAQKYDFRIYNRWGELVFETNDFRQGWNGKYKGALVPQGVYIYSVYAQGYTGQRFYLSGDVTVIR